MNKRDFKDSTKAVAEYLAEHGIKVSQTRLLEAISRGFGERNWSTMSAKLTPADAAKTHKAQLRELATWDYKKGPVPEHLYVLDGGVHCPFCGSDDVEADGPEADGPNTWDNNTCGKCGSTWSSAYKLSGYFDAKPGDSVPGVSASKRLESILAQLGDKDVIVLCTLGEDEERWEGRIYSAKRVVQAFSRGFGEDDSYAYVKTPAQFFGEFVCGDQAQACQDLWFANVKPLEVFDQPTEHFAHEVAWRAAHDHYVLVEPVNESAVEALVEDVKDRAEKYGFSVGGFDSALELVRQSDEVLSMEASDAEMRDAAKRLV